MRRMIWISGPRGVTCKWQALHPLSPLSFNCGHACSRARSSVNSPAHNLPAIGRDCGPTIDATLTGCSMLHCGLDGEWERERGEGRGQGRVRG